MVKHAFEAVWVLGEVAQRRSHYRFRRDKIKRDSMNQQRLVDKQSERDDDFVGLPDYQNLFLKSLSKELEELNKRVSESDKQYHSELERVAALFYKDKSSGSTQQAPTPTAKDSPSSAFEKELAEFKKQISSQVSAQQKQIDEQAQQIRSLLDEKKQNSVQQKQATEQPENIQALQDGRKQLSVQQKQVAEHAQQLQNLRNEKSLLVKNIDALRTQLDASKSATDSLKSRVQDLEANVTKVGQDVQGVKKQEQKSPNADSSLSSLIATKANSTDLSRLNLSINKALNKLEDHCKRQDVTLEELRSEVDLLTAQKTTANTVNGAEQENSELKGKLEDLTSKIATLDLIKEDVDSLKQTMDHLPNPDELDKVMDYFSENDIARSLKSPEDIVENTQRELKALHDAVAEIRRTLVPASASTPAPAPAPATATATATATALAPAHTTLSEDDRAYIAGQDAVVMESIKRLLQRQEGELGDMVDEVTSRVEKLENATDPSVNTIQLSMRIKAIEDQRLSEKCNELAAMAGQLQAKLQKSGIDLDLYNKDGVKADIDEIKEKIEAIELCNRSLDSQWSNLQTRGMADLILHQLNPYGQRHDATIQQLVQDYKHVSAEVKELASLLSSLVNGQKKRTASPANGAMPNPMKRPRVEMNGQQQQQRPSPSSRHSSVGRESLQPRTNQ
ncbi:hypothetical protein SLS62_002270 [Diatrype stigma]|uniref:Uncharacterized protein n=1 Tax=Diatrype stigma TaxID=117547 RepID=A0AAN9YVA4_9PEZI